MLLLLDRTEKIGSGDLLKSLSGLFPTTDADERAEILNYKQLLSYSINRYCSNWIHVRCQLD